MVAGLFLKQNTLEYSRQKIKSSFRKVISKPYVYSIFENLEDKTYYM